MFFRHFVHTTSDERILKMRLDYGLAGYGLFWLIYEYLVEQKGRVAYDLKLIAMVVRADIRTVKRFVNDCVTKYQLFESDGTDLWSNECISEANRIEEFSRKQSMNVKKRYEDKSSNSKKNNELENYSSEVEGYHGNTVVEPRLNQGVAIDKKRLDKNENIYTFDNNTTTNHLVLGISKDSKVEPETTSVRCSHPQPEEGLDSVFVNPNLMGEHLSDVSLTLDNQLKELGNQKVEVTDKSAFIKPTFQQIEMYCRERNNSIDPVAFFDYYEARGWLLGKNPMVDWKAVIRTWEKNAAKKSISSIVQRQRNSRFDFDYVDPFAVNI